MVVEVGAANALESSVGIDPWGAAHISYYDRGNGDLRYAYWDGSAWHALGPLQLTEKRLGDAEVINLAGKVEVIQQDGDWGLLRLFEKGTLVASTATMFTLSWRVPTLDSEVLIDVKPVRGESPFTPGQGSRKSSFLAVFRGPGLAPLKACE